MVWFFWWFRVQGCKHAVQTIFGGHGSISQVLGHDARQRPSPNFQIQTLGSWPSCRLRGSVLPLHCPLLHTNNYEANLSNYSLVKKFRCYVTSLAVLREQFVLCKIRSCYQRYEFQETRPTLRLADCNPYAGCPASICN